jgi:hypothetical protein
MGFGRTIKDEPIKTKTNRGRSTTRRASRKPTGKMEPPAPTPAALKAPKTDAMTVTKTATKPKADAKVTPKVATPPKVTKRPQVTGEGSRNVTREGPMGKRTLANVTREQLTNTGMTLNEYLNYMDENDGKRPPKKKAESKTPRRTGSARPMSERKFAKGGMMKSKMKAKGTKAGGKNAGNAFTMARARMMAAASPTEEKKKKKKVVGSPASGARRRPSMMAGGMMKSKMSTKGGAMGGKKKPPGMKAGGLKPAPEGNKGLKKLPKEVRNKMGFMKGGGKVKPKGAAAGGYKQGGMKSKMATKKKPTNQKVRGAGIARKGVRPAKMR